MTITLFLLAFCASLPLVLLVALVGHLTINPYVSPSLKEFWGMEEEIEMEKIELGLEAQFFNVSERNTTDMDLKVHTKKIFGWKIDQYCSFRDSLLDEGIYALTFEDYTEVSDEDGPIPVEVGFWMRVGGQDIYHTWV